MANRWFLLLAVAVSWTASAGSGIEAAVVQNAVAGDFLVNDDSLGGCDQAFPVVAGDGKGGFVAAWMDQRNGGNGNWGGDYYYRGLDVYLQRYDADVNPLDPNQKVNDDDATVARDSKHPISIAMNRSGGFVVVWEDFRGTPDLRQDIYFQLFDGRGNAIGPNRPACENGADFFEYSPAVAMDDGGGFVIVWAQHDLEYGNPKILFRSFDANGDPIGGNRSADGGGGSPPTQADSPSIAMDGGGRFAIAWTGGFEGLWGSRVCFQRFDASANPAGSLQAVSHDTLELMYAGQGTPSIAMNGSGEIFIAWEDSRGHLGEDVDYYDIYCQRYDSSGRATGGNMKCDIDTGWVGQYHPTAAIGEDGGAVVAWHDNRTNRQQFDVFFQQYDANGLAIGANRNAEEGLGNSSQSSTSLCLAEDGRFIIVWEDDRAGDGDHDVTLRRFDSGGNGLEASRKANDDTGSTDQTRPAVAAAGNGNFIVAWTDERNAFQDPTITYDIYYQRYDAAGNPVGPNRQVNEEASRIRDPTTPAVAADAEGNFVIAWTDNRIHSWDIYCQRFDASGRALGPNEMVNIGDGYDSDQRSPAVAMNSRGDYVIAWMSISGWEFGIRFQLFDEDGHRVGLNRTLEYSTGGDWPAAAMDDEGRFALAWYTSAYYDIQGEVTVIEDVVVERFDAEGKSIGRARKANDAGQGRRGGPAMAMNPSGEFVIAWQDGRNGNQDVYPGDQDVYCQRYDSSGRLLGANQKVNDNPGIMVPYSPAAAIDETGRYVIAWPEGRMGSVDAILTGQGFNADGSRNGDNFQIADGPSGRFPVAASNAEKILFAWQDNRRSKGFDVYARLTSWEDASTVSGQPLLPQGHGLLPNYPNPFNPETVIPYNLPASGRVRLSIFNTAGQWVCDLIGREEQAGFHRVVWDGTDSRGGRMNSGVYFCRMSVESGSRTVRSTRKLCLIR
jgi:hypothetical protein